MYTSTLPFHAPKPIGCGHSHHIHDEGDNDNKLTILVMVVKMAEMITYITLYFPQQLCCIVSMLIRTIGLKEEHLTLTSK